MLCPLNGWIVQTSLCRIIGQGGPARATESWSARTDAFDRMPLLLAPAQSWESDYVPVYFTSPRSPHSRVTTPLDLCHLSRLNIDLERAARAWEPVFRQRHDIVIWAEK